MTTPEDPPATARERSATGGLDPDPPTPRGTGGLDPTPPNPGSVDRSWPPHVVLGIELAAAAVLSQGKPVLLVLLVLLAVSAWAAWILAHLDARHRPMAIGLGAWSALILLGQLLNATILATPGPYTGLARAAFHIEEATRLVTAALPPWMALAVLRKYPPGPSKFRMWTNRVAGAAVVALVWAWLVIEYPALRGEGLRRVYLVAELAALLVACAAILSWLRRPRDLATAPRWYTTTPVLVIVGADVFLLVVGAWRYGLFGDAYRVQQWGLLPLWGAVAAVQGVALLLARRR